MKQISTSLTSKLKQDKIIERDYIIFKEETTRHYLWFNLYDDCYKDGNFIGTFIITFNESLIANKFNLFIVLQNIASSLKFSDILLILCGLGFAIQIIFCGYLLINDEV